MSGLEVLSDESAPGGVLERSGGPLEPPVALTGPVGGGGVVVVLGVLLGVVPVGGPGDTAFGDAGSLPRELWALAGN